MSATRTSALTNGHDFDIMNSVYQPANKVPLAKAALIIKNGLFCFGDGLVHGGTSWYKTRGRDEDSWSLRTSFN